MFLSKGPLPFKIYAEDVEYIRQNHAALLSKYDEVCQSIAAL